MNTSPPHERLQRLASDLHPPEELPDRRGERWTIEGVMDRFLVPGCSVAIIEGGRIVASQGYGRVHQQEHTSVTTSTIFQACSISKAVAGVGAMRLVQEGKMELDEDVNGYLESWQIPANAGWQPRVTLRHLLTHTAGLGYCWFPGHSREATTPTSLQALTGDSPANTPPVRVVGIPGSEYRYSGAHYAVVEKLMEDVTGEAFPRLTKRLVFDPLGMDDSSYDQAFPESRAGAVAAGHDLAGIPLLGDWHLQPEHAGAGLWTTPGDLCRLAIDVQKAWSGESPELLSQGIAREMLTPGPGERGLGWQLQVVDDWLWFDHGGSNVGYKCHLIADTRHGYGAAIMTNGDAGRAVYTAIFDAIAHEYGWPDKVIPGREDDFRAPEPDQTKTDPGLLEACPGEYRLETGLLLSIGRHADRLSLEAAGQPEMTLLPVSESTFLARSANAMIIFRREVDGSVETLALRQAGDEISGERIDD